MANGIFCRNKKNFVHRRRVKELYDYTRETKWEAITMSDNIFRVKYNIHTPSRYSRHSNEMKFRNRSATWWRSSSPFVISKNEIQIMMNVCSMFRSCRSTMSHGAAAAPSRVIDRTFRYWLLWVVEDILSYFVYYLKKTLQFSVCIAIIIIFLAYYMVFFLFINICCSVTYRYTQVCRFALIQK